jgi:putative peptide zinc metalloprotease protein
MAPPPFLSSSWYRISGLRPILREHAQIHRHRYRHRVWFVLRDDFTGRVHRLSPAAYWIVAQMDGRRCVDELWLLASRHFGESAPTQDEVLQLLSQLHGADLMQCDAPPDVAELFERHTRQERSRILQMVLNPTSVRIPLWDPDRFLGLTLLWLRPAFGWFGAALWLALTVPALFLAAQHWPELTENAGDRILAADNLLLISLIYPVVKILHEFGHGYVAKALGAEVHEVGLMFIMFLPMPYVDASAAAGFRSKYRRAAVGAAGILVELSLATLALYVWLAVEPGLLRAVCFNVMVIASISTIVFNGNPLMRYDGYYVLSDLLELPNLAARASTYWGHVFDKHVFGAKDAPSFPGKLPGEQFWLVIYAPASFIYRLVVQFGIAVYLAGSYFFVGVLLAVWVLVTGFCVPVYKGLAHVVSGSMLRHNRMRAMGLTASTALVGLVVLFGIPAPLHTTAQGVIWLPQEAILRAATDGFVERVAVAPGSRVKSDAVLIESENPELRAKVAVLREHVSELENKLAALRFSDRVEAGVTSYELDAARSELSLVERRAKDLAARSGASGVFAVDEGVDLPGRFFHQGEVLAYVIPDATRLVRVTVDQNDIELVRQHLRSVEVKPMALLTTSYPARLVGEVPAAQSELPSRAFGSSGGGEAPVDPRDNKGRTALQRVFQFDLETAADLPRAAFGSHVLVRFEHDWEPLGSQFYRRLRQLLLSRLLA